MTNDVAAALLALADELEEPVMRAAIYEGPVVQARHEGEDAERLRIAATIRSRVTREVES